MTSGLAGGKPAGTAAGGPAVVKQAGDKVRFKYPDNPTPGRRQRPLSA
ncbi:hypothetical protein [Ralstonia syzygii]|nr:hypothetical protein [Ralstonia syzygii]